MTVNTSATKAFLPFQKSWMCSIQSIAFWKTHLLTRQRPAPRIF
jgi:hypothetical protein